MVGPNMALGLTEAVRNMEERECFTSSQLEDLIIAQVLWSEQEMDDSIQIGSLVDIYTKVHEYEVGEDSDEVGNLCVDGNEAYRFMRQRYLVGYATAVRQEIHNEDGVAEGFNWPSCIEFRPDWPYPKKLSKHIGFALGYQDGRMAVAIARHVAENTALSAVG